MSDLRERLDQALSSRYRVLREVGSGGMAHVFLAEDLRHARKVALKVLRPELAGELGVDRFLREIRIAAGLSHPHILPLFDSGEADGLLYFVMPYVEGETLRERLTREGPLPLDEVVRLVREVGSALGRAHEAGVVHRDVKPSNILLERDRALVADFGVARAVDAAGGERLTRTGMAIGTPAYMSPEQVEGVATEDGRSDLYGLACLAYEALAGEPPFTGSSARAIVAAHLARAAPPLRERRPDVPAGVERAIACALSKDPADRFATTTELIEAITEATTRQARLAEARRAARRRRARIIAAVAAVPVAGLGGWWLTDVIGSRLAGPSIERLAVLPASNLTRDPADDAFVDGVHEALVTELQRAGISIIARQSVLQYRNSELPIRQIAEQLGVDALIQPAVGREGASVIVDVSLVDGRTELPLWTDSFASELRGVLGLYREVSGRIAGEIGTVLTAQADARLAERPQVDPQVLEAVYNGQFHLRRFTPQDFTLALEYFEQALAIDSMYAPAQLGVASVWGYRAQAGMVPIGQVRPLLDRHLERALDLDPDLARARFIEGASMVWADWEFEAGADAIAEALELDPNDAETRVFYGHALGILRRFEEALEQARFAMELDPQNAFVTGLAGTLLASRGRYDEAIGLLTQMFEDNPGTGFGRAPLMNALEAVGRYDEALEQRRLLPEARIPGVLPALESGLRAGGYREALGRWADAMAEASARVAVNELLVAGTYARAGDADSAIEWLETALERRNPNLPYLGGNPSFEDLHDDPRFQRIAAEVGVELQGPETR